MFLSRNTKTTILLKVILAAIVSSASFAQAQESKKVVIAADESAAEKMLELSSIMRSHFRDLNAEVYFVAVALPSRDIQAQIETIRELVLAEDAFSAVWVEQNSSEVFLFVSDKMTKKVFLQTFDTAEEAWEIKCETIAALVRSALITWLEVIPNKNKMQFSSQTTKSAFEQKVDSIVKSTSIDSSNNLSLKSLKKKQNREKHSTRVSKRQKSKDRNDRKVNHLKESKTKTRSFSVRSSKLKKRDTDDNVETDISIRATDSANENVTKSRKTTPIVAGIFDVSFVARMIYKEQPWNYNARLSAGLLILRSLTLGISSQIGSSSKLSISQQNVVIRHYPIYFEAGYFRVFKKIDFQTGLAFVTSITYLYDASDNQRLNGSERAKFGVGVFAQIGYRVLPMMALTFRASTDLFFKIDRYNWETSPIFYYGSVQPFFSIGVQLYTSTKIQHEHKSVLLK